MPSTKRKLHGGKGGLATLVKRRKLSKAMRCASTNGGTTCSNNTPPTQQQPADSKLNFATPTTLFESLIAPQSVKTFFDDYWEQKPLVVKGAISPSHASDLFSFDDLRQLVSGPKGLSFGRHVNVCRYVDGKRESFNDPRSGKLTRGKLEQLWREKCATFQVHQPQHFKDVLWRMLAHLETYFGCLVGSNIYMTPADSQGLAPHYDDVEVFIIQLEGCKRWKLYANAHALPQEYSRDFSQDEIGESTHDIVLETGDLMYFPRGTIHQAHTAPNGTHSTHITISTYQHNAWGNLLGVMVQDALKQAMDGDVAFRRGIPCNLLGLPGGFHHSVSGATLMEGDTSEVSTHVSKLIGKLTDHLQATVSVRAYSKDFMVSRLPPYGYCRDSVMQGPRPDLKSTVALGWPDHTYLFEGCDDEGQRWVFVYHSLSNPRDTHMVGSSAGPDHQPSGVKFPAHFGAALKELFSPPGRPVRALELPLPSDEDRQCVLTSLWAEGLIRTL